MAILNPAKVSNFLRHIAGAALKKEERAKAHEELKSHIDRITKRAEKKNDKLLLREIKTLQTKIDIVIEKERLIASNDEAEKIATAHLTKKVEELEKKLAESKIIQDKLLNSTSALIDFNHKLHLIIQNQKKMKQREKELEDKINVKIDENMPKMLILRKNIEKIENKIKAYVHKNPELIEELSKRLILLKEKLKRLEEQI